MDRLPIFRLTNFILSLNFVILKNMNFTLLLLIIFTILILNITEMLQGIK